VPCLHRASRFELQPFQRKEVRGRGELEVQIDAPLETAHELAVEHPRAGGHALDGVIDGLFVQPAVDVPSLGAPRRIAHQHVIEMCWAAAVQEDGGPLKSPARLVPIKAGGVVSWGIESSPQCRGNDHAQLAGVVHVAASDSTDDTVSVTGGDAGAGAGLDDTPVDPLG
jgi:hypothetical protein